MQDSRLAIIKPAMKRSIFILQYTALYPSARHSLFNNQPCNQSQDFDLEMHSTVSKVKTVALQ
jgi:hypothetical protein